MNQPRTAGPRPAKNARGSSERSTRYSSGAPVISPQYHGKNTNPSPSTRSNKDLATCQPPSKDFTNERRQPHSPADSPASKPPNPKLSTSIALAAVFAMEAWELIRFEELQQGLMRRIFSLRDTLLRGENYAIFSNQ